MVTAAEQRHQARKRQDAHGERYLLALFHIRLDLIEEARELGASDDPAELSESTGVPYNETVNILRHLAKGAP